jgi:glutamine synthetase type III
MFGPVHSQIDQNLMAMQIVEEVSAKHGLAALFQEKPFQVRFHNICGCMLIGRH